MDKRRVKVNMKPEFETTILDIARVARVTAGGKRLSFRATVAVGKPESFQVGIGIEKGKDVAQAIQKATRVAQKNLITVPVVGETIPHEVVAKYSAAKILLKPAKKGKGIIAGGIVRAILKLSGIPNVTAKVLGRTNNPINNARATILALKSLKPLKKNNKEKEKE